MPQPGCERDERKRHHHDRSAMQQHLLGYDRGPHHSLAPGQPERGEWSLSSGINYWRLSSNNSLECCTHQPSVKQSLSDIRSPNCIRSPSCTQRSSACVPIEAPRGIGPRPVSKLVEDLRARPCTQRGVLVRRPSLRWRQPRITALHRPRLTARHNRTARHQYQYQHQGQDQDEGQYWS